MRLNHSRAPCCTLVAENRVVQLNVVLLRGVNDDELPAIVEFSRAQRAQARFIEYMPLGLAQHWNGPYVPRTEILDRIRSQLALEPPRSRAQDAKMKRLYEVGLAGLAAVAKRRFEKPFVDLTPEQQDYVLAALESGKVEGWPHEQIPSHQVFEAVRAHTITGFLADPKYGGSRGYAGWKVPGYPRTGSGPGRRERSPAVPPRQRPHDQAPPRPQGAALLA